MRLINRRSRVIEAEMIRFVSFFVEDSLDLLQKQREARIGLENRLPGSGLLDEGAIRQTLRQLKGGLNDL